MQCQLKLILATTVLLGVILLRTCSSHHPIQFLGQPDLITYVSRATPPNSVIYRLVAISTVNNRPEDISYSLIEGTYDPHLFDIEHIGHLTILQYLPLESWIVGVQAELGHKSTRANLSIIVLPEYNLLPVFEHSEYTFSLSEYTPINSLFAVVRAFSLDPESNEHSYNIISGNTGNDLAIDITTGVLYIAKQLDYETTSAYDLTVQYSDSGAQVSISVTVHVVDENDNAPLFSEAIYTSTLSERASSGTSAITVSANDRDSEGNGMVEYSIVGNNAVFEIERTSGKVTTATELDFEVESEYSFTVVATDHGHSPLTSTVIVTVQVLNEDDECPVFESTHYSFTLSPESVGMEVVTLYAIDPDGMSNVTYSLGSANPYTALGLDQQTGEITLSDTSSNKYTFLVFASDAACDSGSSAEVIINVYSSNSHRPQFASPCEAQVRENSQGGIVTTLNATDDDAGVYGKITYAFPPADNHQEFQLDPDTGVVTLSADVHLDYESQSSYLLGVTATDGGNRQAYCLLSVTVLDENDNAPQFFMAEYEVSISHNATPGTYVVQMLADDADDGLNRVIEYTLLDSSNDVFVVDSTNGVITTVLDLTQQEYSLTVRATNPHASPPTSTTATLTVIVVSDFELPSFNQSQYSATICENLPVSSSVLQVFPTTDTSIIHYSLFSGSQYYTNSDDVFEIHPDGTIIVSSQGIVDFEQLPDSMFQFSVKSVSLLDGHTLSISTVEITVLDSEDNRPEFQADVVSASVTENEPAGTLVAQLVATDPDSGTNSDISLLIDSDMFDISESGALTTLTGFNAEAMSEVLFESVTAVNPNGLSDQCSPVMSPIRSATVLVRVTLLDINDNSPSFEDTSPSLSLPENTTIGTSVYTFTATDDDVTNDPLRYTIVNGNTHNNFIITDTGTLVLIQSPDYETSRQLTLQVNVSDGTFTDMAILTITVTDVDDEAPHFSEPLYSTTLTENAQLGTTVLQVSAADVDTTDISYWLTGTAEGRFSVSSSGVITVVGVIDREEFEDGVISFLVVAQGGSIATALVSITINDVNDCVPRFSSMDLFTVEENIAPEDMAGIYVGTVTATDSDFGRNGEISYTLLSGAENGFTVDSTTGDVFTHSMYDREDIPFYTLVVEARDQGESMQLSSTATVLVKIGDVNDNTPFFPFLYIFTRIFENSLVGTEVIELPAIDRDEGPNAAVTFQLLTSEPDIGQVFELNSTTGLVTLVKLLDYESPLERSFTLTFSVSDSVHEGVNVATLEVELLDVNDHTPILSVMPTYLGLNISESIPVGTDILHLAASDEDSGSNAEVTFSIFSGDPNEDFVITTAGNNAANVSTAHQLDYESKTNYDLIFQACDQGYPPICIMSETNITIANIDDVVPSFSQPLYEGSVMENAGPTNILQVMATDPDFGDSFEYRIESGNSDGKFSINSTTGVVNSIAPVDREEQETYVLVITAADEGGTPLTGTGTAVITVIDVNDNDPANDSMWQVDMLLVDGRLTEQHSVDFYFGDPDLGSTYSHCTPLDLQHTADFFTFDPLTCALLLNEGNPPENTYSIKLIENEQTIFSRVNIEVEHIQMSDIPTDHLVTISLATSAASYLNTAYTSFPEALAAVLGVQLEMLNIVSAQSGYHDPENTVDISFFAETGEKSYIDPALILHTLYTQRDNLESLGYELSALPTDPCSSEPCISQASCNPVRTVLDSSITIASQSLLLVSPIVKLGYECECIPGTTGENCGIDFNDCYSNPCHFGAQCIDEVNGFKCVCPLGTSEADCSVSPNGCSSNPCQNGAMCKDTPGSHACICLPGYYGPECQYQYFRTASTCDSSPCQNNGTCSPGRDSFTCICPDGYSGQLCELEAISQGCSSNPCYNGSTCMDIPNGPVCTCSMGFTGPLCRWQIDNCELDPCRNRGTCATGLYGSYQCYCPPPYTGETCEDFVLGCESSPCLNGGRCTDTGGGSYTCECVRGYSGNDCEHRVQPLNLCSDNPCVFGNCTYGLDAYTCSCLANYSGVHCENESVPSAPCDSNPCQHGGTCDDTDTQYMCTCSQGFSGPNCETDIDDCISNPCVHGVCKDGISGYVCECTTAQITGYNCDVHCPDGQSGEFCEVVTLQCEVDGNPCQNGGSCMEQPGGYSCECPPTHTGPVCEQENTCDAVECFNGGTCSALEGGGYGCVCSNGYDGPNCQLVAISFTAASSTNSYRAYPSLHLSARGSVEFEFSTVDSDGLLLYNTQVQYGRSRDYIAVEILGGQLVVGVSHGDDDISLVPMTTVSDGQWHRVSIDISEKSVAVTLDYCHELDEITGASAGCYITAATGGQSNFLDLGLPLWLGGSPSSSSHVSSVGITACMRHVYVNHLLLDLNSHLDQSNSQPGCPQLEGQCGSGECGAGDCIATWSTRVCVCPPLLSGDLCDTESSSLSFTGSGYAHYTLTETERDVRSTYSDRVSLSLRTTGSEGLLFSMYDKTASEYLYIALESGQVVVYLDLGGDGDGGDGGGGKETVIAGPGLQLNDSQRHHVMVDRTGRHLNISVDSSTTQHSLSLGTPLTLETHSSEVYTGGSPHTPSWFTGCLQDVRINQHTLPTSGSNAFASVVYEGVGDESVGITEGCILSPCYDSPCGSGGTCVEMSNSSYECVCSSGEQLSTVCPQLQEVFQYTPHVVGASILAVLIVVISITLVAGVCVWRSRRKKRTYLIGASDKMGSQELAEVFMPSQAIIISNEQGGGEEDTDDVDWAPLTLKCGSSAGKPSPPVSTPAASSSKESPASRASHESKTSTEVYQFRLPVAEKEGKGVGERGEDDDGEVKSNSPIIRAYLEERVNTANDDVLSVDSVHKFCEEGSEDSEVDSLSSVVSSEGEEEYTLERLTAAGSPLSSLAPLLEHVLQSTAEFSTRVTPSASDMMLSSYTTQ